MNRDITFREVVDSTQMAESKEDKTFEQLVQRIEPQSKFIRAWELKGGVSAQVTALEIEQPGGQTKRMVVRQHGDTDLRQNPHIAADEFKLLDTLRSLGLATPTPYHLDRSGTIFTTPYLVIEYIEGETEFAPANLTDFILQMATHLSRIHRVDSANADLSFLPSLARINAGKFKSRPAKIDESLSEGKIRDTLASVWPWPQHNTGVLLHGDFWPGNILWRDSQLVGVIDWEDAVRGDPLADVANSRLELLWAFGIDAMNCFTDHYKSMTTLNFTGLPYWDLYAALRPAFKIADWAADDIAEQKMREGHRLFITQAFAALAAR